VTRAKRPWKSRPRWSRVCRLRISTASSFLVWPRLHMNCLNAYVKGNCLRPQGNCQW
jgi:hypothetical protein